MKKVFIGICVGLLLVTGTAGAVFAQTGDVAQDVQRADIIRANCHNAQTLVQQVGRNDKALRINRGRAYEKMLKLMYAFNARVAANNRSMPELSEITAAFEKRFNTFRSDYDQYADALQKALRTDCANQPVTFYESLIDARAHRQVVHNDTAALNELLNQYQSTVNRIAAGVGSK